MKRLLYLIPLSLVALLLACGKESDPLQNIAPATGAKVRFFHAASDAPAVDIYLNDKLISGAGTTVTNPTGSITYGASFPAASIDYADVPAGSANFKVKVPSLNNTTVFATDAKLEAGKSYTYLVAGTSPNYTALALNDDVPAVDGNSFYIRFVNLLSGSTSASLTLGGADQASNIAYGAASGFVKVPLQDYKGGTVTISGINAKVTPTTGTAPTLTALSVLPVFPGRAFTVIVRGVVGGTGTKAPTLSSFIQR